MTLRVSALPVFRICVLAASVAIVLAGRAEAGDLPPIKLSATNTVPACVTPGRLTAYLESRNSALDAKYQKIAVDYMRHGEELKIRWDYAFFQMVVETGNLTFKRLVKPRQNNFAGLGATGPGEPGESFPDVTTGVRAHLQHVLMYSGETVENPVAERTRKVQEWGVLTSWQKGFTRPITFRDLAGKWAPTDRSYPASIEAVADRFFSDVCNEADPKPELLAEARRGRGVEVAAVDPKAGAVPPKRATDTSPTAGPATPPGASTPAAQVAPAKAPPASLPVQQAAVPPSAAPQTSAPQTSPVPQTAATSSPPVRMLNKSEEPAATSPAVTPSPRADLPKADPPAAKATAPGKTETANAASAGSASKPGPTAPVKPSEPGKCRVWTASYGGQKAIIIRAPAGPLTHFTVLEVNEGSEKKEADAYIAVYARGGQMIGEFPSQAQALDKAFDLCPEG